MIFDNFNEFADAVSVAAAAGTAQIGDTIDLGATPTLRNLGAGEPIYLVITTDTEIITGGSAGTIKFQLASDSSVDLATNGTATVHFDTGTMVTDDAAANDARLNAGGVIAVAALPSGDYERYLGILCVTGTTTTTAGKINAFLTHDPSRWQAYADAI